MKMLLLPAAAAVVATAAAILHNPGAVPGVLGGRMMPVTSLTRAQALQHVQRDFAGIDINRDGFVTKAEARAAMTSTATASASASATATVAVSPDPQQQTATGEGTMFDQLDTSQDGIVTRAEAEAVFATGRMAISYREPGDVVLKRNWEALVSRHDANGDGEITRAEFDARHTAPPDIGSLVGKIVMRQNVFVGRRFERADSNQDGKLSLEEATNAALVRFDAADTNGDGTLSDDELRQRFQEMMKRAPRD